MTWTVVRREGAGAPATVASGDDELEGYMALWAHSMGVDVDYENDGRGNMWPVGRGRAARFILSFGAGMDIDIGDPDPTRLLVLMWWVFGKRERDYRTVTTTRSVDEPKRDRLEQIARLHRELRDGAGALKKLGLDYMKVLQGPDD